MVKTRAGRHAIVVKNKTKIMIDNVFGKTLILRRVTRLLEDGQLVDVSNVDVSFTGDLQFGFDLDQKYLKSGIVEVGDAILYLHPDELSTLPSLRDKIVDGISVWRIKNVLKSPELGGTVTHYEYRCTREIKKSDS